MSAYKIQDEKKQKTEHSSTLVAIKAKNEVFYQMASIFKAVTNDEDAESQKLFNTMISQNPSDFLLENQV